jgi:hypothetical protein
MSWGETLLVLAASVAFAVIGAGLFMWLTHLISGS